MEKFLRFLFSMKMMALGLILFLLAIGAATILESKYNIQAAKIIIYNAVWFEILLVFLGLNLIANIFRYKMFQRHKIAMLMFHLSFLVILIGAGITRYISFEGQMRLPEPDPTTGVLRTVDYIYSSEPKLDMNIDGYPVAFPLNNVMYMSEITDNYFKHEAHYKQKNKTISVEYVDFKPKHIDSLVINDSISEFVLDIVTGGMSSNYLEKGGFLMVGQIPLSFEGKTSKGGIELFRVKNQMMMKSHLPMTYLPMSEMQKARESGQEIPDSMYVKVPVDSIVPFRMTTLYKVENEQFVFKGLINHAKKMLVPSGRKDAGLDYLTIKVSDGKESKIVVLEGGMGQIGSEEAFFMNGSNYRFQYGAVPIKIPFALACNDFILDRYPGSEAPSSFESTVTVIDSKKDKNHTQRIFMNNVMDYDGYRFFQSGYFPDESGTILSVNHDWWGTNVTYLGYLMMSIGMVMSLFSKGGRFRDLNHKLKKIADKRKSISAVLIGVMISFSSFTQEMGHDPNDGSDHSGHNHAEHEGHNHDEHAEHNHPTAQVKKEENTVPVGFISKEHSEKLAYLMVQDFDGRIAPFHTVCDELLRKIHRDNVYKDGTGNSYNAVQTILSMHMSPDAWMSRKIIYVSKVLRESIGINGNYASIRDLLDDQNNFKLEKEYRKAHQKLDKNKDEFDKQLIKLVERYQIIVGFPSWTYLKLIPVRSDATRTWYSPMAPEVIQNEEDLFRASMEYFKNVYEGMGTSDYSNANQSLETFINVQRKVAGGVAPSKSKIDMEVSYNKMNIFKNAEYSYLILGFGLLFIFFIRVLVNAGKKEGKAIKIIKIIFTACMVVIFLYHGSGLLMRWYISGHAPWSNGYEAVIFIAWVTMLAGFIFSRKNAVIIAATAILAFFMIFVTEMNLLDPEITPLQPVLKSYWLMIHVAIITGSYGFLGLGAILGLVNLILYIFRTKKNSKLLTLNINELTYVSEMTITIGLFMLTIGTFLGGIWANESWGRYWGWDPKETWALVSVLVYAVILHLRYIPALQNKFTFNVVSFWGYTSIIFTFFGVNFYLVGLHSYAQGDGLAEVPSWILYTVIGFYAFTELAWLKYKHIQLAGETLKLKIYIKKVTTLIAGFLMVYLFLLITGTVSGAEFITMLLGTISIFIATNVALLGIQKLFLKGGSHAIK